MSTKVLIDGSLQVNMIRHRIIQNTCHKLQNMSASSDSGEGYGPVPNKRPRLDSTIHADAIKASGNPMTRPMHVPTESYTVKAVVFTTKAEEKLYGLLKDLSWTLGHVRDSLWHGSVSKTAYEFISIRASLFGMLAAIEGDLPPKMMLVQDLRDYGSLRKVMTILRCPPRATEEQKELLRENKVKVERLLKEISASLQEVYPNIDPILLYK
jgi:hypothetical protein